MQAPTWLKPAIMGAVAGGIATMIVGFNYGGWYLGSSAETLANKQSNAAVFTALVPVCQSIASGSGRGDQTEGVRRHQIDIRAAGLRHEGRLGDDAEGGSPNQDLASACADVLAKTVGS